MKPLSSDLRDRVLECIDNKEIVSDVAKRFKITRQTIYNWQQKRRENIPYVNKAGRKRGFCPKIDEEKLRALVEEHPDMYGDELATYFNCGTSSIYAALKRMDLTKKKVRNLPGIKRGAA